MFSSAWPDVGQRKKGCVGAESYQQSDIKNEVRLYYNVNLIVFFHCFIFLHRTYYPIAEFIYNCSLFSLNLPLPLLLPASRKAGRLSSSIVIHSVLTVVPDP